VVIKWADDIRPQLVKKLFWDAEGGVPYKIIYEE
jgi:hypothetical protein